MQSFCFRFQFLLFPLLVLPSAGGSQEPDSFKAEAAVIRSASTVYSMNADGTGVETETLSVTIQSEPR